MRTRVFAVMITALVFCGLASAQGYDIRATGRNNLRAAPSLDGTFVETVPPGTVLHVIGMSGRWLRIHRNGRDVWMADWIGYTRIESSQQTTSPPASDIDNCCFVDRQCNSDQEWTNGYHAFQSGQCAAPEQSQQQTPTQPVGNVPAQVDNCCFVDRRCHTDAEWTAGYHAFLENQCAAPVQSQQQVSTQPVSNVPAQVDNCCFVDRQCNTPADWENGYYAFQNNQCPAATGARQVVSASPAASINVWTPHMTEGVKQFLADPSGDPFKNCCYMHHNTCHSEEDWQRGAHQYQNHECAHPAPLWTLPTIVDDGTPVGSARFTDLVNTALDLIRIHAPEWFKYLQVSGVRQIHLIPAVEYAGFYNQSWLVGLGYWSNRHNDPNWAPGLDHILAYVTGIMHEACHAIKQRTYTQTAGWANEAPCNEAGIAARNAVRARSR